MWHGKIFKNYNVLVNWYYNIFFSHNYELISQKNNGKTAVDQIISSRSHQFVRSNQVNPISVEANQLNN